MSQGLSSPLATAAKQDTLIAAVDTLESIFTDVIGFETVANLGSGATYSSGLLALSPPYSQVLTNILSDRTGTMYVYWYSDAGGTDLVRTLTVAYTAGDGFLAFGAPAFTKYVKYEFTNSAGASTTDFYFTTKFLTKPVNAQIATLSAPLSTGMVAALTRSVLVGQNSAGGSPSFVNVKVNPSGTLEVNSNAGTDLNTSLLALEAGGNLAAVLAKIIAAPATEAKQDAEAILLSALVTPTLSKYGDRRAGASNYNERESPRSNYN